MMTLKTLLVVFLLVLSVGFSVSLEDFLDVSLLDEIQDNRSVSFSLDTPVVISWMEKPPYVMFDEEPLEKNEHRTRLASSQPREAMKATNDNSGINQESGQGFSPGFRVKGIFQEVVSKGLQICLPVTKINFRKKAGNLQQLDKTIVNKEADLALPVQGSEDGSYGGHTYVEVLKSPGVVFIVDKQQTLKHLSRRSVTPRDLSNTGSPAGFPKTRAKKRGGKWRIKSAMLSLCLCECGPHSPIATW